MESDPLDYTGDFFGRGSAFRDYGSHAWGFIFPWRSALGDAIGKALLGIRLPGSGSGRLGRFRGAGSLCDQVENDLREAWRPDIATRWGAACNLEVGYRHPIRREERKGSYGVEQRRFGPGRAGERAGRNPNLDPDRLQEVSSSLGCTSKTVRENGQLAHRGCNARKNMFVPDTVQS